MWRLNIVNILLSFYTDKYIILIDHISYHEYNILKENVMKKCILLLSLIFFLGCATTNIEKKLENKYGSDFTELLSNDIVFNENEKMKITDDSYNVLYQYEKFANKNNNYNCYRIYENDNDLITIVPKISTNKYLINIEDSEGNFDRLNFSLKPNFLDSEGMELESSNTVLPYTFKISRPMTGIFYSNYAEYKVFDGENLICIAKGNIFPDNDADFTFFVNSKSLENHKKNLGVLYIGLSLINDFKRYKVSEQIEINKARASQYQGSSLPNHGITLPPSPNHPGM